MKVQVYKLDKGRAYTATVIAPKYLKGVQVSGKSPKHALDMLRHLLVELGADDSPVLWDVELIDNL